MKMKLPVHGLVPISLLQEGGLTLADLKVYTALASFQGHNDEAFPSRHGISKRAGIPENTVSRAITHLIELGWIERIQRGQRLTNIYRVLIDGQDFGSSEIATSELFGSSASATQDVAMAQHPSIEQKQHSKTTKDTSKLDPLFHPTEESFLSQGRFATYKKEAVCIKAIIKAIRNLAPDDAEATTKKILETFLTLTKGNERFWKDLPFLPSSLSPHVEKVWAICQKGSAVPSMDWFDKLERQHA